MRIFVALIIVVALATSLLLWGSEASVLKQLTATIMSTGLGVLMMLWILKNNRFDQIPVAVILGLALFLRLLAAQASPLLEDDHYRYLWDGYQTATQLNPYQFAPSHFFSDTSLSEHWRDILFSINYPEVPTIYGPVLQGLFATSYFISPGDTGPIQLLLVLVDMAVILTLLKINVPIRLILIYAVHPLILKESIASAHPDIIIGALLLLCLVFHQHKKAAWVGIILALAVATKISCLLIAPFLLFMPKQKALAFTTKAIVAFILILSLVYLPFIMQGASDFEGLRVFSQQWTFNPLFFAIATEITQDYDRVICALLIITINLALFFHWINNDSESLPPIDLCLLGLLIFAPVVNPWYALWIIAPAIYLNRRYLATFSSILTMAYFNSTVTNEISVWGLEFYNEASFVVSWPFTLIQILVLVAALLLDRRHYIQATTTELESLKIA